jgi:putative chitinase
VVACGPTKTGVRGVDVAGVLDLYEFSYGSLRAQQREGLSTLLRFLIEDPDIGDARWAAYMLATVKHECADTWRPIEEYGHGQGRRYGEPQDVRDANGVVHRNTYYGRGYVQLTWKDNYADIGRAIGRGDELLIHPELALEPGTAYRIMSHGMRHGTFTGKSLRLYVTPVTSDYRNARRIINGTDQAERIEGYARRLETMLLASG